MHVPTIPLFAAHLWVVCGFQRLSETPDGMAKFRKTQEDTKIIEWIRRVGGYKTEAAIWRRALRCLKTELLKNGYKPERQTEDDSEQKAG